MNRELLLDRAARLLEAHPFPGADPNAMVDLLNRCQPLRLMDGAELCQEGEPGAALFFLVEGAVQVWKRDARGQPKALARLDAPALVGHMAVVDGSTRSATCTAIGSVRALLLERPTWALIMGEASPAGSCLRRLLLSSLSQQLSATNRQLRTLLAGTELEEDLPELEIEEVDPADLEVTIRQPPPSVDLPPPPPQHVLDQHDLQASIYGQDFMPDAASILSEEDLLEVTGILEGWKSRRS